MRILTLAFLFREDKVLLAMKKRGFGVGKWNGYGGKLQEDESAMQALVREFKEESNLLIPSENFKELGHMDFYFEDKPEWNQKVYIYRVDEFVGEPEETEEMLPRWFSFSEIPWSEMWKGYDLWLQALIEGKKVKGRVHFGDEGEKLVSSHIETY